MVFETISLHVGRSAARRQKNVSNKPAITFCPQQLLEWAAQATEPLINSRSKA
jgi:hypothetical protein